MTYVSIGHQKSYAHSIDKAAPDVDSGQELILNLKKWESEATPGEFRDVAAARMIDCENRKAGFLDLTDLQLVTFPECLPSAINEIAIDGNRFSADVLQQIKENTKAELIGTAPVADEAHVPFMSPEVIEIFALQVEKMMSEGKGEENEAIMMVTAQRDAINGRGSEQQARVNEKIAKEAYGEVRRAYVEGDKSSNKIYKDHLENDVFPSSRRLDAREKIGVLQHQWNINIFQERKIPRAEKLVFDAGNCEMLATASAKRVVESGGYAEVWRFDSTVDHVFTVVGAPPSIQTVDFENWQGIWIMDAWANILCEAPAYLEALNKKMEKWNSVGKLRIVGGETSSPVSPELLAAVTAGIKQQKTAPTPLNRNPWQSFSAEIHKPTSDAHAHARQKA